MLCYKIFEKIGANSYKFLFHQKRLILSIGKEVVAEKKMVYDAYNKATGEKNLYLSGIHVVETLELCQEYLKRFKDTNNKAILLVEAEGLKKKQNARPGVMLADKIKILKEFTL